MAVEGAAEEPPNPPSLKDSRHMAYASEILVFSLVGLGWLSARELMSDTPVMDVTVMLSLFFCSVLNLMFAVTLNTTENFHVCASAFLCHVLATFILYVYSLAESVTQGTVCCDGNVTYSRQQTYAAAFFGGLPFHQAAAAITIAFLIIFLILAAGQMRVCSSDPKTWVLRGTALAVCALLSLHPTVMSRHQGLCQDHSSLGNAVISMTAFAFVVMIDWEWANVSFIGIVQRVAELVFSLILVCLGNFLSSQIASPASPPLLVLSIFVFLWHLVQSIIELFRSYDMYYLSIKILRKNRSSVVVPVTEESGNGTGPEALARFSYTHSGRRELGVDLSRMRVPALRDMKGKNRENRERKTC